MTNKVSLKGIIMSDIRNSYCSWCFKKTRHHLHEHSYLSRNIYQCKSCGNFTLKCRWHCENMVRGRPKDWKSRIIDESFFQKRRTKWNKEFCAEHDGSVASFKEFTVKWDDLEDYKRLFKREKYNLVKAAKYAGGIIGGTVVIGPLVYIAAPSIAGALGTFGVFGSASTGTAISTLSGAALTSASLAAIGGGSMATGVVVITAVGAGLGAIQGGVVSNKYFSEIKDFSIQKFNEGKSPALIFINGFLSQKKPDFYNDWRKSVRPFFSANPWYGVTWESKTLYSLGRLCIKDVAGKKLSKFAIEAAKRATRAAGSKLNPVTWATLIADMSSNPWYIAQVKAAMTGTLLADLMCHVENTEFILMGNSLGCRVIYYLLNALSTRENKCIVKDVYLLGGAVGRKDEQGWENAATAVADRIHNCYSSNDKVLKYLYKPSNAWLSEPAGLGPITCQNSKICNHNVPKLVSGHMEYKNNFAEILRQIKLDQ